MSFKVLEPGILTLFQDKGRFSHTHVGVTVSGFLDEYAAFAAHKLLNNTLGENLLEIAFSNVVLEAQNNTILSITGAYCEFFINEIRKNTWESHIIKKGDIVRVGKILKGQRVYLAVKNGFKVKKEFGSVSTTLKEGFGQQIKKEDILFFDNFEEKIKKRWQKKYLPKYENHLKLRVLLSYQEDSFPKIEKEKFFKSRYKITSDFNRMACKLNGEKIRSNLEGIISEAISLGSIQIPKDGQPIILLKERQTIGGYPKIGCVLSIDCFKLAQMKVGSTISFEQIDISSAQEKLKEFYTIFS